MNTNIEIFKNDEFGEIRTVVIENEPWFVGKDIATALGYKNTKDALLRHVDKDDKQGSRFTTSGQSREMTIINESGLYSLILSSKLESAKRFKRWVTKEVLPSIRKHGAYLSDAGFDREYVANLMIAGGKRIKELEHELALTLPKVRYVDEVLQCRDAVPITLIAEDYGMSARKFNKLLKNLKIQYKQSGTWVLYSKHKGRGYTSSKTTTYAHKNGKQGCSIHTYWTQSGRMFIYDTLKKADILPVMERN